MVVVMMGRSDWWNVKGMNSKQLQLWDRTKLLFLQSKIGELAAIIKFNLQYKCNHAKKIKQGARNFKEISGPLKLKNFKR